MGYVLGVDLGTTFTAAAVGEAGAVEIFPLADRAHVIPSVLLLREDGEVLVGDVAERRSVAEPGRAAREFKRRLGDPTPLLLGGTPYGADALMAMLLKAVVAQVAELRGAAPDLLCLTHPASYGDYKQDLLRQVAQQADVADWVLTTEPQAAAVNHAASERVSPGDVFAVYDLGGGTFDAALVRAEEGGSFRLLGTPEGLERIGGIDFDQAVLAHVDAALDGQVSELDLADPVVASAVARLRQECREAKEALSSDTDASIPVMLPNLSTEVRIQRSEFEAMIRPRVDDTIEALSRAVRSAGLGVDELTATLLVGGSSRIPLVRERVRELTNRPVALDAHPKHSIALGAARVALAGGAPTVAAAPEPAPEPEPLPDDDRPIVVVAAEEAEAEPAAPPAVEDGASEEDAPEPPGPSTTLEDVPLGTTTLEDAPVPAGEAPDPAPPGPAGGRSRGLLIGAAVVGVLVVVGVLAVVLTGGGDGDDEASSPAGEAGGLVDIPVADQPVDLVATDADVFVTAADRVSRLEASTGEDLDPFDIEGQLAGVADGGDVLWVVNQGASQVLRIDPSSSSSSSSSSVDATVDVDAGPTGVAVTSGAVWVTSTDGGTVFQIAPDDGSVVETYGVGVSPLGVGATEDDVWVANSGDGTVAHIDRASSEVTFIDVGGAPTDVAVTDGTVWVSDPDTGTVVQIDSSSREVVQSVEVGADPAGVTTDGTFVYVANTGDDTVSRIEASSGEVVDTLTAGDGPTAVDATDEGVWVLNSLDGTVSLLEVG